MRRQEAAAFTAFLERHHVLLLRYARRARLEGPDADALVQEVIEDAVLDWMRDDRPVERSVRASLVRRFRNAYLNRKRDAGRRARWEADAVAGEPGLPALASEHARRSSTGAGGADRGEGDDPADPALGAAISGLATALDAALSAGEREMLTWVSEHVPQREIGEWLGVPFHVVRKRLQRLREKLARVADAYSAGLDEEGQVEVARFRRRCAVPRARGGSGMAAAASAGVPARAPHNEGEDDA